VAVDGEGGSDTLVGPDAANIWNIAANDAGDLGATFTFSSIENLTGGSQADDFAFSDGVGVSGNIDGSGGNDTLDYSAYSTAVSANQQTSVATGI
jgi:hypothetical protein